MDNNIQIVDQVMQDYQQQHGSPANSFSMEGGDAPAMPEVVEELLEIMRIDRETRICGIGKIVAGKREEAIKAKNISGIERIWAEDEEYYVGIDDANRHTATYIKPPGMTGGLSRSKVNDPSRSSAFFNITGQFCDSASARMGDILIPAGDWNFAVKPTPVPDKEKDDSGPLSPPAPTDASPSPLDTQQKKSSLAPDPESRESQIADTVNRAELQIRDWLVGCSFHSEERKVLDDCVRIGTGILKGPIPKKNRAQIVRDAEGKVSVEYREEIVPASYRVSPWDFFPDPSCGDNVHDGSFVLERYMMTPRQLRDLKGVPGFLSEQIDKVLDEGPSKKNYDGGLRRALTVDTDDQSYEVWYYYGDVCLDDLNAMQVPSASDGGKEYVPAVVVIINDTPIKAFLNPLDSGDFPYDVIPWQPQQGIPWGIGVARKGRVPQDMLNAAARAMMDNAGLSSGPQLVIRSNAIRPADGSWMLTPRKIWLTTDVSDVRSAADAISAINIPMMQNELLAIIQQAYKMMEDSTGVLFIMQGQQGSAPDTVGGMELLHRNATATLRRIARVFDERITEPHIRRYYSYLLQHGPDDCKGEMQIEAIGSTAMVEREIQVMELTQLLQFSLNPVFGLDPEMTMNEILIAKRFIPSKLQMSDAKKKQMSSQPQVIPAVEAAKIRADATLRTEQIRAASAMHKAQITMDRDTAYTNAMTQQNRDNAISRKEELQIKREAALLKRDQAMADYANQRSISLDKEKALLAKAAMTLRVQSQMAKDANALSHSGNVANHHVAMAQVAASLAEPPGKAANGEGFTQ